MGYPDAAFYRHGECVVCRGVPHAAFFHCVHCHAQWTPLQLDRPLRDLPPHTFGSLNAFDRHLLRRGGCIDPALVVDKHERPVFGRPRPNKHGTLVWRCVGRPDARWPT